MMNQIYIFIFLFLPSEVFPGNDVFRLVKDTKSWGELPSQHPFQLLPNYKNITDYLETIAFNYGNIVSLEDIGTTFEERTIYAVKISTGGVNKPKILIDAGIHGYEWVAPLTAIYVIHQLITNTSYTYLYQNVDWYIIPSLNPDGYEYTLQSGNRWWRKNRSINVGSRCIGTDLDRNFDIAWADKSNSDDPCTDFYRGFTPFSEAESKALRNLFRSNRGLIKVYLSLHSFGLHFLFPWRWTRIPPKNRDLLIHAFIAKQAIAKRFNTQYVFNRASNIYDQVGGTSVDWMFAVSNGPDLSYTIELPGYTFYTFNIIFRTIGLETLDAFTVFHSYIEEEYTTNS